MATGKLDLEIVTPERLVVSETVDEVILPGSEGSLGVLPGHAPLLTALAPGEASYRAGGQKHTFIVTGGFVEVLRDRVSVLASTCERPGEIDVPRARAAKERAEAALKIAASEPEVRAAQDSLRRAVARIEGQRHAQP